MTVTTKKTMSYSVMHLIVAFLVAYAVSRDLQIALGISLLEPAVQTVFFYFHEKIWARIAPAHTHTPPAHAHRH